MPTYQYACTNPDCGNRFELVQSFSDPSASECPVCDGPVRKVFSSVGVVFKGSGFYRTDSRAAAKSSTSAAKSANGSDTAKSSTPASDSSSSSTTSTSSTTAPAAAAS